MIPLPPLTVVDVETTGLDPTKGHRIVEIAGVRIEDGVIREDQTFVSLVNPDRDIPWEARRVNRIDEDEARRAESIDVVLPKFLAFSSGTIFVAHNALFDMNFLRHEKEYCWGFLELPACLCTLRLSRTLYPHEFGHNLDALSNRLGLSIPSARHRALPDVLLTAKALLTMIDREGIPSFDDLASIAMVEHSAEPSRKRRPARV